MKLKKYREITERASTGEVFTPSELVREKLSKLDESVFISDSTTFFVPGCGLGVYLEETVKKLMEYGHSEENAKSRVIGIDIRVKYINLLKLSGYRVFLVDFLSKEFDQLIETEFGKNMKFDVVLGNPPWQEVVGPKKTRAIWGDFVKKSFSVLNSSGYLSLIHPPGWRNPGSSFKKIEQLIRSNDIKYLAMYSVEAGQKIFKVTSPFDVYVLKKEKTKSNITTLKLYDGSIIERNIGDMPFVPNGDFDRIKFLLAKDGEERVDILYSSSDYEIRNSYMTKEKTDEFVHPCIRYVYANGEIDFWYSSVNKGHFGIPKVIMGFSADTGEIIIDDGGNYGMTQFTFGIVDEPENLPLIKTALDSDEFKNLMTNCRFSRQMYNHRVIPLFRKDFWKEFI